MARKLTKYDAYDMQGRPRLDAVLALANCNPLLIARGVIDGITHINKFGENPEIENGETEDIWDGGGTYTFPTGADITHIAQATDQVGTDGGATIEVQGLDVNWELVTQTADLDGTDTTVLVELGTALRRVFRMKVLANIVAADDISAISDTSPIVTYATMQAGNNQTLMAIYTVPADKTAYMTQYYVDNVPTETKQPDSVEFRLWAADRHNGYEFQLKHMRSIPAGASGLEQRFTPPLRITQKTDIKISASVEGGSGDDAHPHAGFDLILIDD